MELKKPSESWSKLKKITLRTFLHVVLWPTYVCRTITILVHRFSAEQREKSSMYRTGLFFLKTAKLPAEIEIPLLLEMLSVA